MIAINTELIGSLLELLGKLMLAIAILLVHSKMGVEHKIDQKVIDEIKHEKIITYSAIFAMVSGFIITHL